MKLRTLIPALAVAAGALLANPASAAPWTEWPEWLETPKGHGEIEFLPGMDPSQVDWEAAAVRWGGLRAQILRGEAESALDAIAREESVLLREWLLVEAALLLGERGGPQDRALLEPVAAVEPESAYLAPHCTRPHRHVLFDTATAARHGADQIAFREGFAAQAADSAQRGADLRVALRAERHPAKLAGRLAAMEPAEARMLAADARDLSTFEPTQLDALAAHLLRAGEMDALFDFARSAPAHNARRALDAWAARRAEPKGGELIELMELRRVLAPSVLAALRPVDDAPEVREALAGLLGDARLGANASMALRRVAPDAAFAAAADALQSADPARARRGLIMMMAINDAEAREAVRRFVESTEDAPALAGLRKGGAQWLGETR